MLFSLALRIGIMATVFVHINRVCFAWYCVIGLRQLSTLCRFRAGTPA